MKVIVRPTHPLDEGRAEKLAEYVQHAWTAPVTSENFFQFLAFMWLLARAQERMMRFWRDGGKELN